jgi:hypothetical protein
VAKNILTVKGEHTKTVGTQYSTQAEMHVPGWDSRSTIGQKLDRTKARLEMGQKMTPLGPGVARKK